MPFLRVYRRLEVSLAVCALAMGLVSTPHAQQPPVAAPVEPPPSEQRPTFRSSVDTVIVDVVVTDRSGRAILDLTPADFELRESGKPQTIDSFRLVQTDNGLDDPAAQRQILSFDDQRRETEREANRLFVVFLDDYHVRRGNSMRVREELAQFLLTLSAHDLVAIATPLSSGLTFSRSHESVASNVRNFVGRKFDYTPMNAIEARYQQLGPEGQEQFRNEMVMSALRSICEQLGSLRTGRKSVLYVSEGMSATLPTGVRTTGGPGGAQTILRGNDPRVQTQDLFEQASLMGSLSRVFSVASRNNVSIYSLDPRGLSNFEYGVDDDVTTADDRRFLQESLNLLKVVAEETDGRAIVGRNDPMRDLQQMVRDSSTYYLLSYVSSLSPRDGKFHEIDVRVNRPGVQVRARKGYWAYSPEDVARITAPPRPPVASEVSEALDNLTTAVGGARSRGVTAWMGAARGPGSEALVTFVWEAAAVAAGQGAEAIEQLTIVAQSSAGAELFRGVVPRDAQPGRVGGLVTFEAPAGSVEVRLTAENARGRRVDTGDASMMVPDFSGTGPMLSTPFVYRGRTARDLQQVRLAATPTPAIRRVFSRSERLLVRFGAYGPGGAEPKLAMRLLNSKGDPLASLAEPIRGGDLYEGEVLLSSFPPGDYVVEITAQVEAETAKQLFAIRVTG